MLGDVWFDETTTDAPRILVMQTSLAYLFQIVVTTANARY
jgi:hypothetical protein